MTTYALVWISGVLIGAAVVLIWGLYQADPDSDFYGDQM